MPVQRVSFAQISPLQDAIRAYLHWAYPAERTLGDVTTYLQFKYNVSRASIRGALCKMSARGDIIRVGQGVYRAKEN